jgi:hypothetical protein
MIARALHMPPVYLRRLILRAFVFWFLVRLASLLISGSTNAGPAPMLRMTSSVIVVIAVGVLARAEMSIRGERTFIANIGVWPALFIMLPTGIAAALEVAAEIALRALVYNT